MLARAPRVQGAGGPLLYATAHGVRASGVEALPLRRAPAPVTMPHHEACARVAAYLTRRDREMIASRELMMDERWASELEWREHGELRRRGHRPDLIATVDDNHLVAIEVELVAKSPERLRAVLATYAAWLCEGRVDSLLYVVTRRREADLLEREAPRSGLVVGRQFGVQQIDSFDVESESVSSART